MIKNNGETLLYSEKAKHKYCNLSQVPRKVNRITEL